MTVAQARVRFGKVRDPVMSVMVTWPVDKSSKLDVQVLEPMKVPSPVKVRQSGPFVGPVR